MLGMGGSRASTLAPSQSLNESCSFGTNTNRWAVVTAPPGCSCSEPCIVRGPGVSSPVGAHSGWSGFSQTGDWGLGTAWASDRLCGWDPSLQQLESPPRAKQSLGPCAERYQSGELGRRPSPGEGSLQEGPQGGSWEGDSPATRDPPVWSKEGLSPGEDAKRTRGWLTFHHPRNSSILPGA